MLGRTFRFFHSRFVRRPNAVVAFAILKVISEFSVLSLLVILPKDPKLSTAFNGWLLILILIVRPNLLAAAEKQLQSLCSASSKDAASAQSSANRSSIYTGLVSIVHSKMRYGPHGFFVFA